MTPLILASSSQSRIKMLKDAGLTFDVKPADIDERAIELDLKIDNSSPEQIAGKLASVKALSVSQNFNDSLVIGADQTLSVDGMQINKVDDLESAREKIARLSGKTHCLHSAVSCHHNGSELWKFISTAYMSMRSLDSAEIDNYISQAGVEILSSVGCYQLEGIGIQLFEKIEGDFFTILGLPLLPLLKFLREQGYIGGL